MTSFIWVKKGDDNALMEVLDKYGPVAVAIDASSPNFVSYSDNFYGSTPGSCSNRTLGF